ncbi:hypothetical protein ACFPRL_28320 [Pseudoclavibacter helvolus]
MGRAHHTSSTTSTPPPAVPPGRRAVLWPLRRTGSDHKTAADPVGSGGAGGPQDAGGGLRAGVATNCGAYALETPRGGTDQESGWCRLEVDSVEDAGLEVPVLVTTRVISRILGSYRVVVPSACHCGMGFVSRAVQRRGGTLSRVVAHGSPGNETAYLAYIDRVA